MNKSSLNIKIEFNLKNRVWLIESDYKRNKPCLITSSFFWKSLNLWCPLLMIVLYHQTKTPISIWCKSKLNPRSLIQPLEILPDELTGTHMFNHIIVLGSSSTLRPYFFLENHLFFHLSIILVINKAEGPVTLWVCWLTLNRIQWWKQIHVIDYEIQSNFNFWGLQSNCNWLWNPLAGVQNEPPGLAPKKREKFSLFYYYFFVLTPKIKFWTPWP